MTVPLLTPAQAAAHMMRSAIEIELGMRELMEAAGEIIEHEAKAMLGHYQTGISPFEDWAGLSPSTIAERESQGYPPDEPLLRSGAMRESIEHRAVPFEAAVGSDEDIAVWQESGTRTIPRRSFLGGAAVRREAEIVELVGAGYIAGMVAGGRLRQMIRGKLREAPNVLPYAAARSILSSNRLDLVVKALLRGVL